MKIISSLLTLLFIYTAETSAVLAFEIPQFTSCLNPQGVVKASYETGTHGIAGKPGLFAGKDVVYKLAENALTQCFCAVNGGGIQTDWWKTPLLSEPEIKTLEAQGWIYISNGVLWGLDDAAYMAKNSDFSCKSSAKASSISSGNSDSSSVNSGSGGISNASSGGIGQVLGLASTGNSRFLLAIGLTSGLSLTLGLIFKIRIRNILKKHA